MSNDFWSQRIRLAEANARQAQADTLAVELTYRNPNLGAHAQAWIDGRQAKNEANRAAAGAMRMSYLDLDAVREQDHLTKVQQYHATAHRQARGRLSEVEANVTDMGQYTEVQRPRASYSDYF
ncbi:hypothetical protein ACFVRB_11280 [Streptomyces nojiriensis]|uniref:hypothetical protein n=1 Tax=Streptomyces nojiriensis TaxID=66374 RepID=UPI0036DD889B